MKVFARTPINLKDVQVPHGQIYLIPERCKGCKLCIFFCPQEVLCESSQTNAKGYHYPEAVPDSDKDCINCEFCMMVCPEFAIYTQEVSEPVVS